MMKQNQEKRVIRLMEIIRDFGKIVDITKTKTCLENNLTQLQFQTLGTICRFKGCIMRELSSELMIHLPAATRLVEHLVKRDLIKRVHDTNDRRVIRLIPTKKGETIFKQIHMEAFDIVNRVLENMSQAEQDGLIHGMDSFLRIIKEFDEAKRWKKKISIS